VTLTDQQWDETAVRKVLHTFAFGGAASDAQIKTWAQMTPEDAIKEIITFAPQNPLLAPRDADSPTAKNLANLADFFASDKSKVAANRRAHYLRDNSRSPENTWSLAVSPIGLNPVRQRIGLFETNYHLSVNRLVGVNSFQLIRYYDDIMDALAADLPYHEVLAVAAQSAAVATQYNHRRSQYKDGRFRGNDDFARELHQLFFGILGSAEAAYHEQTTIPNTARALTDMPVKSFKIDKRTFLEEVVTYGSEFHYPAPLEVLHQSVDGKTAKEKIAAICALAIAEQESLDNLPLIIVSHLADDNLTPQKTATIRAAWKKLQPKSLLTFLRSYAISTTFHSADRVKYWTSFVRNVRDANLTTLDSFEVFSFLYDMRSQIVGEGVRIFEPTKNVFGSQTGHEAAGSGQVFRQAYNRSVQAPWLLGRVTHTTYPKWQKDWSTLIPKSNSGNWNAKSVGEWLWQRYIADGLKHFGALERAHIYAILGAGKDLAVFINKDDPKAVYTEQDLTTRSDLKQLVQDLSVAKVLLDDKDAAKRKTANYRVGLAISFITATPYAFAQEGR
jgi:hypothetical protein